MLWSLSLLPLQCAKLSEHLYYIDHVYRNVHCCQHWSTIVTSYPRNTANNSASYNNNPLPWNVHGPCSGWTIVYKNWNGYPATSNPTNWHLSPRSWLNKMIVHKSQYPETCLHSTLLSLSYSMHHCLKLRYSHCCILWYHKIVKNFENINKRTCIYYMYPDQNWNHPLVLQFYFLSV